MVFTQWIIFQSGAVHFLSNGLQYRILKYTAVHSFEMLCSVLQIIGPVCPTSLQCDPFYHCAVQLNAVHCISVRYFAMHHFAMHTVKHVWHARFMAVVARKIYVCR